MPRRQTHNRGFTLVEVIVTLVVLVILAGTTYGAVKGLVGRAEQTARDQVARSLFMAAQSALTHTYANDPALAADLAEQADTVVFGSISPQPVSDEWDRERSVNRDNIVSLQSDGGAALMSLLASYVDDQAALAGHIVIEFNRQTGNVLACFYSDETALSHGDGGYDVYNRDEGALRAGRVGYFGVEYTGSRAARLKVDEPDARDELSAMLVDYDDPDAPPKSGINGGSNYGLLTLECALPAGAPADTVYSIEIHCYEGENVIGTYSLTVGPNTQTAQIARNTLSRSLVTALDIPVSYREGNQGQGQGGGRTRQAVVFIDVRPSTDGRELLVIVLDSQVEGRGIRDLYGEIDSGDLVATVSALSAGTGASYRAVSNSEHALYASVDESKVASVASVRHLNNVRYDADGDFVQTRDIPVVDYTGEAYRMAPIGDADAQGGGGGVKRAFSGSYNGGNYGIEGLTMPEDTRDAGLFGEIGAGARVEHVLLLDGEIAGERRAGGIAAENNGTIYACTVYHTANTENNQGLYITAMGTGGVAGGVTAENNGTVQSCYVGTGVRASNIAGGVAGISSGTVSYSEVCTAMAAKVGSMPGGLAAPFRTYFGAVSHPANYYYGDPSGGSIDANQRWIKADNATSSHVDGNTRATSNIAGGVVGVQQDGRVECCVNAAQVSASTGVAGGVVGSVFGDGKAKPELRESYNAGWVKGDVFSGGVAGQLYSGAIRLCYNTAPVNCFVGVEDAVRRLYLPRQVAQSTDCAGGVVGRVHLNSTVEYCYNASYVLADKLTPYAGVFGRVARNDSKQPVVIRGCYFLRNCLNVSERYYLFTLKSGDEFPVVHYRDGNKTVTMLDAAAMAGLTRATDFDYLFAEGLHVHTDNNGIPISAGPYFKRNNAMQQPAKQYAFPVLNVNAQPCNLGLNFHRTPYYPILERYAALMLARDGDNYVLTAWIPEGETVTLRLNTYIDFRLLNDQYYAYNASMTGGGSYGSLTFTCQDSQLGFPTTFSGTVETTALTESDAYYALGCRQKYVITISTSQDGLTPFSPIFRYSDFHGQMRGPSRTEELGGAQIWCETKAYP